MVLFKKSHKYPSTYKTGNEKDAFPVRGSDSSLYQDGPIFVWLFIMHSLPGNQLTLRFALYWLLAEARW